jgi:hypothetical protein
MLSTAVAGLGEIPEHRELQSVKEFLGCIAAAAARNSPHLYQLEV